MAALSTAARSLTPKAVFSIRYQSAAATTAPQAMANSLWAAIERKPRSTGPRSASGSGIVFSVGPKT